MRRVSRAGYSRGRVLRQRGRDARAVAAGLGLSILSEIAIQADHRVLTAKDGFSPIDKKNGLLRRFAPRNDEVCNFRFNFQTANNDSNVEPSLRGA